MVDVTGIEPVTPACKADGENTKGFVWCRLYGQLAKFSLSQMSRSCTELFGASELPKAVSCWVRKRQSSRLYGRGRSNSCPSHYLHLLNSLSEFGGLQTVIYHGIYRKEVIWPVPPNCSATAVAKQFAFPRIIGSRVPRCMCAAIRLREM